SYELPPAGVRGATRRWAGLPSPMLESPRRRAGASPLKPWGPRMQSLDESARSVTTATWRDCALFAVAYFIASEVGYSLSLGPSVGGTFWPPSGVALAVFLLASKRSWPALIVAAAAANFVSDQVHGQNLPASFGFAL